MAWTLGKWIYFHWTWTIRK